MHAAPVRVTFVDASPAVNHKKQEISVLTFADYSDGSISKPVSLNRSDTQELIVHLLVCEANHGHELAQEILSRYFMPNESE